MSVPPETVIPAEYEGLASLCWNRNIAVPVAGEDALAIYEANWRHLDTDALSATERDLIRSLADRFGGGHLLVTGNSR